MKKEITAFLEKHELKGLGFFTYSKETRPHLLIRVIDKSFGGNILKALTLLNESTLYTAKIREGVSCYHFPILEVVPKFSL